MAFGVATLENVLKTRIPGKLTGVIAEVVSEIRPLDQDISMSP